MQRIAALVGGVLLLAAADACPTCIGPTWSWDRFPAFFHWLAPAQRLSP